MDEPRPLYDGIDLRSYIDNQVEWIRRLKLREREDLIRDIDKSDERQSKFEDSIQRQVSNITRLVYIGLGIILALQFLSFFLKKWRIKYSTTYWEEVGECGN